MKTIANTVPIGKYAGNELKIKIINSPSGNYSCELAPHQKNMQLGCFYRCGWCGNVVDFDGSELSSEERNDKIRLLGKFDSSINVKFVTGYCCEKER